jgi:hypothetical protein
MKAATSGALSPRRHLKVGSAEGGMLKLPARLRRDLILMILIKVALLSLLYFLFFSPSRQPVIDAVAHIASQRPY